MKFSRILAVFLAVELACGVAFGDKPAPAPAQPPILPPSFAGWELKESPRASTDPAAADPTNAAVLREYRFTDLSQATFTRDDGRTLKIRAARFADASGAFGAYTFYLEPAMTKEQIGDQGASLGNRVLFYRGHILIDAQFSQETSMSGAELRELAGALPKPGGNNANLPAFIAFLPRRGYVTNTQKYVMGPIALNTMATPVPGELVDFGASAEVSFAHYSTPGGEATLMLISYPTPQLAADHLRRIDAAHQVPPPKPGETAIAGSGSFFDKRTGPILAIATDVSESDARALLGMVNYEASVTWNSPSESAQVRDLYKLILNIVVLCGILAGLAIVAGVAFGGIRVLVKRLYPEKVFDRPEQMEFISLRLTERAVRPHPQNESEEAR